MPSFFSAKPGTVARVDGPGLETAINFLRMDDAAQVDFTRHLAIVTRVFAKKKVNIQFAHSVGPIVYAYSFGDRMGQFALSGHVFAGDCDGGDPGVSRFKPWYDVNRASNREKPVELSLGSDVYRCFLLDQEIDVPDASTGLANWTSTFATLPSGSK